MIVDLLQQGETSERPPSIHIPDQTSQAESFPEVGLEPELD